MINRQFGTFGSTTECCGTLACFSRFKKGGWHFFLSRRDKPELAGALGMLGMLC